MTDVQLNFTYGSNGFNKRLQHPVYRYANKEVVGKVIAYTILYLRQKDTLLNFFKIKEEEYSQELKKGFDEKFLPQFYDYYWENLRNQSILVGSKMLLIELLNGKLKKHETILKY